MAQQQDREERERLQQRLEEMEAVLQNRDEQQVEIRDLVDILRRQGDRQHHKVKPPTFDGKQDVAKFLQMFEEVRDINNWNNATAALQLKLALTGTTRETAQGETYQEIRDYLRTRYEVTEDEARQELKIAKLKKGDNIYDFGDFMLRMAQIAYPNLRLAQQEDLAVKQLVDVVGDWMLRREFRNQPPADYKHALQRIQEYMNDKGSKTSFRRLQTEDGEEETSNLHTDVNTLKKEMKALQSDVKTIKIAIEDNQTAILEAVRNSAKTSSTTQREQRECFYCKIKGHLQKDCRKKKKDEERKTNQTTQKSENSTGLSA